VTRRSPARVVGQGVSAVVSYRLLADIVVIVHFAFVVFVVVGGLLALRWPKVLWAHVPAVLYSVWIIAFSITCPLTPLERDLRERGGEERYQESFIERYVEGVLYPGDMLRQAQAVAAVIVVGSWGALAVRAARSRGRATEDPVPAPTDRR
jgi:hypothetical protein